MRHLDPGIKVLLRRLCARSSFSGRALTFAAPGRKPCSPRSLQVGVLTVPHQGGPVGIDVCTVKQFSHLPLLPSFTNFITMQLKDQKLIVMNVQVLAKGQGKKRAQQQMQMSGGRAMVRCSIDSH